MLRQSFQSAALIVASRRQSFRLAHALSRDALAGLGFALDPKATYDGCPIERVSDDAPSRLVRERNR
jgi:hypothetical protein